MIRSYSFHCKQPDHDDDDDDDEKQRVNSKCDTLGIMNESNVAAALTNSVLIDFLPLGALCSTFLSCLAQPRTSLANLHLPTTLLVLVVVLQALQHVRILVLQENRATLEGKWTLHTHVGIKQRCLLICL